MYVNSKWAKLDEELQTKSGIESWVHYLSQEDTPIPERVLALKQLRQRLRDPGAELVSNAIQTIFTLLEILHF